MLRCTGCRREIPEGAGRCPQCGTTVATGPAGASPLDLPTPETVVAPPPGPAAPPTPRTPGSSAARTAGAGTGRFSSGQLLGERYRIVALLGRGGMGEVYRADDLRLGESVALKFLPPSLAQDHEARRRLQDEVRVTRQISHPNVCRVHDLVEVEKETCISMEYIDGEDLGALLRRIGRFPEERGVQIARQLCAGLAAAHERGVLHRDLKPANVMVDGRGRVKITDFGIAALVELAIGEHEFAGTPLYMAPEVIRGEPATPRSDIYSLGLVLYELFTGRRAIEADSMSAIRRWHEERRGEDLSMSTTLAPPVRELIARCLSLDPEDRPSHPLQVAAMLPGGDPLIEVLAAGETPSPELVAAAGGIGTISRRSSSFLLAAILLGIGLVAFFDQEIRLTERTPMALAPDVLEHRAQTLLQEVGYLSPPKDSARGFGHRGGLVQFIEREDVSPDRWDRLSDPVVGVIRFWYRQSPDRLVPFAQLGGRVRLDDPPQDVPGMATVVLSAAGDLVRLSAVPSPTADETPAAPADWATVLRWCGFDGITLEPAEVTEYPSVPFDEIQAFTGPHPTVEGVTSTIVIAMWRGRPVSVQVSEQWQISEPRGEGRVPGEWLSRINAPVRLVLFLIPLFAGAWFGIANLRAGRGDRPGAFRVGVFFVVLNFAVWVFRAHHVGSLEDEQRLLVRMLSEAFFVAVFAWVLYLAIEPTIRRHWPQKLVSWMRLLRGTVKDPLVGRDILVGIACGVGMALLSRVHWVAGAELASTPPAPLAMNFTILDSVRQAVGYILFLVTDSALTAIIANFLLVLVLLLTRRRWSAYLLIYGIGVLQMPYQVSTEILALDIVFRALVVVVLFIALDRSLLSMLCAVFVFTTLAETVVSLDPDAWYLTQGIATGLVVAGGASAVALCACREQRRELRPSGRLEGSTR